MAYKSVPTLVGQQKIAQAIAGGPALTITHMAVGDGNGAPVTPLETQVALVHEVWRGEITSVTRDLQHPNHVVVVATVPLEAGPFMVRELGLYDSAGSLIAVGSHPEIEKTALSQGMGQTLELTFIVIVDTAAQLTIVIENRPQSDWLEVDTTSGAYIRNKPVIPGIPPTVPLSRKLEARKGLAGGGDLSADRWFDISWTELAAASAVNASDLLAVYQALHGSVPADHRKMTLEQLAGWIVAQVTIPTYTVVSGTGLVGGGVLNPSRTLNIDWTELAAAAQIYPSDLIALRQAAQGDEPADHRRASVEQLLAWLLDRISVHDRGAPGIWLEERRPVGTHGGAMVANVRSVRQINTLVRDEAGGVLVFPTGAFNIPAGSYYVEWCTDGYNIDSCRSFLRNASDSVDLCTSRTGNLGATGGSTMDGSGLMTLAAGKTLRLEVVSNHPGGSTTDLGLASGYGTHELYSWIKMWRL